MNYFSRFLISFGLISSLAFGAAGDRYINNPNNNADTYIQVNKAGVTTSVIKAEGSTGKVIVGTGTDATVKAGGSNTDLNLEAVGSGGAVVFKTNGTERARVNQVGRWTMGLTGLADRAAVFTNTDNGQNATVLMQNTFATVNDIGEQILALSFDGTTNPTGGYFLYFRDNDTSPMGSVTAASATTIAFNTTSDARLKYDIKPMENALKRVLELSPSSYKWKEDGHSDEGLIAQNVKKVYPSAVHGDETGDYKVDPMQVDYGKLTPLLAAAIKEQQEIIVQLKARLETLENR